MLKSDNKQFFVLCDKQKTVELGHPDTTTAPPIKEKAFYEKINNSGF